ncbi:MAG: hypothetical protein KKB70_07905 [Proteobacteria bacterium]|nr:hypothetical protein [Pseudomonadota bacterium]
MSQLSFVTCHRQAVGDMISLKDAYAMLPPKQARQLRARMSKGFLSDQKVQYGRITLIPKSAILPTQIAHELGNLADFISVRWNTNYATLITDWINRNFNVRKSNVVNKAHDRREWHSYFDSLHKDYQERPWILTAEDFFNLKPKFPTWRDTLHLVFNRVLRPDEFIVFEKALDKAKKRVDDFMLSMPLNSLVFEKCDEHGCNLTAEDAKDTLTKALLETDCFEIDYSLCYEDMISTAIQGRDIEDAWKIGRQKLKDIRSSKLEIGIDAFVDSDSESMNVDFTVPTCDVSGINSSSTSQAQNPEETIGYMEILSEIAAELDATDLFIFQMYYINECDGDKEVSELITKKNLEIAKSGKGHPLTSLTPGSVWSRRTKTIVPHLKRIYLEAGVSF